MALGIVVIRQVAGDVLDPDGGEAVGIRGPGVAAWARGNSPAGILAWSSGWKVLFTLALAHMARSTAGQHQDDISPIETVAMIGHILLTTYKSIHEAP